MTSAEPLIGKNQDVTNFTSDEHSILTWMVGGAAGDGIMSASKLFAKMLMRNNYYTQYYTEYPSLIRGGHNNAIVRVSTEPITCQITPINILFALNKETIELHIDNVVQGGSIIYDPRILRRKKPEDYERPDIEWRSMPLREMTMELDAAKVVRNTIGVAGTFAMLDLPAEEFTELLNSKFKNKPSVAEINVKAAEMGYEYMNENHDDYKIKLEDKDDEGLMMLTGNSAIAAGLIAGGINFYSGYPMSPSTSLLEDMVKYSDEYGFMTLQAEDEIAAVTLAIGANHAGARGATGTSGGGVALMTEAIGLAASAEIPLVVVNIQRPGPSTGMPTWTGQGDLLFCIRLGQDSFPRIVLAPGDIQECYELAAESLNYAEEYQVPVILMSDKWLAESGFASLPFDDSKLEIRTGKTYDFEDEGQFEKYKRFVDTEDGVSPRAIPGLAKEFIFKTTGNEHDELGRVDDTGPNRIVQMEKRMRKMGTILDAFPDPKVIGSDIESADMTVFSWGSNKGIILDTMDRIGDDFNIAFVHVTHIWPFPKDFISEAIEKSDISVLIEQNYEAQFGQLIKSKCLKDVDRKIIRYDGRPFDPVDLRDKLQMIHENH